MKRLLLIILTVLYLATGAQAASILVSWNANEELDLAGYKVYYAQPGDSGWTLEDGYIFTGPFEHTQDVGNVTEYIIPDLIQGPYAIAVTAYDTSGNESDYSEIKTKYFNVMETPTVPVVHVMKSPVTITITIEGQ